MVSAAELMFGQHNPQPGAIERQLPKSISDVKSMSPAKLKKRVANYID